MTTDKPTENQPSAHPTDRRATLQAGRAGGLLASEIASGRMTLGAALETAALSPEFNLDADELDYVCDRLRDEFGPQAREPRTFRVSARKVPDPSA